MMLDVSFALTIQGPLGIVLSVLPLCLLVGGPNLPLLPSGALTGSTRVADASCSLGVCL